MINLVVPSGIGDIYWILMKILPNTKEPVRLKVCHAPHKRAKFLEYIDGVDSVEEDPHTTFLRLRKICWNKHYTKIESKMFLECNTWLEKGKRIEDYLPQLKTQHKLKWNITKEGKEIAESYIKPGKKNIAIYTSSYAHNKQENVVGDWRPERWVEIVEHLHRTIPDLNLIWLGASWDTDMIDLLKHFPCISFMTDQPADAVITVLRKTNCFIAYQCGLSVISICEQIPTFMVYFDRLDPMHYAYAPKATMHDPLIHRPMAFRHLKEQLEYPALWASGVLSSWNQPGVPVLGAHKLPKDIKIKENPVGKKELATAGKVAVRGEDGTFRNLRPS